MTATEAGAGDRLVIHGEPGIGRTCLLDALAERAARRGLRVVRVTAAPGHEAPAGTLLEDVVRAARRAGVDLRDIAGEASDPSADRAALALLDSLAAGRPTLVLVDDAQWADLSSLARLVTAAARLGAAPLGVVLVEAIGPPLPPMAAWPRLVVGPVDRESACTILRGCLGPSVEPGVLATIADALHDHPMSLARAGEILSAEQIAGRAALPDRMPVCRNLLAAWAPVLDALTGDAQAVLLALAVTADHPELLAAAAGRDVADGIDELVSAGLVVAEQVGAPRLRPGILRDVVTARGPRRATRAAHRRAAQAASDLGLPADLVVEHLLRAATPLDGSTARVMAREAARAEQDDHLETAVRAWVAAARMAPSRDQRVGLAQSAARVSYVLGSPLPEDLMFDLADADLGTEDRVRFEALRAERAIELDPRATLASVWSVIGRTRSADPGATLIPLLDAAMLAWLVGDAQSGLRAAQLVADLQAGGVHDPDGTLPGWAGMALLAAGLFQAGEVARATSLRRAALAASRSVDPWTVGYDQLRVIITLDDLLLDASPEAVARARVEAERGGGGPASAACRYGIDAWRARAAGNWAEARALLDRGRVLAASSGSTTPWLGMTALAVELAALTGDDEALDREALRLRQVATRFGDRRRMGTLDRALGLRALVRGNLSEAISWLSAAADVPFLGRGLRDAVLPARVDRIEALVRSGDLVEAAGRHAQLHRLLAAMDDPLGTALDERAAALLTGGEEAEAHYRAALVAHAESGEAFEWARTELLLGEHLRRVRRRSEARVVLHSALHRFDALGAAPWSSRARDELRLSGGRADTPATDGGGSGQGLAVLTPQERAVVDAVASGMTNREVAEALVLSRRTVEYHLSNAYRKLGVHGRGALARALAEAGARAPLGTGGAGPGL